MFAIPRMTPTWIGPFIRLFQCRGEMYFSRCCSRNTPRMVHSRVRAPSCSSCSDSFICVMICPEQRQRNDDEVASSPKLIPALRENATKTGIAGRETKEVDQSTNQFPKAHHYGLKTEGLVSKMSKRFLPISKKRKQIIQQKNRPRILW